MNKLKYFLHKAFMEEMNKNRNKMNYFYYKGKYVLIIFIRFVAERRDEFRDRRLDLPESNICSR